MTEAQQQMGKIVVGTVLHDDFDQEYKVTAADTVSIHPHVRYTVENDLSEGVIDSFNIGVTLDGKFVFTLDDLAEVD